MVRAGVEQNCFPKKIGRLTLSVHVDREVNDAKTALPASPAGWPAFLSVKKSCGAGGIAIARFAGWNKLDHVK
jgi:hypothetical protein